MAKKQAAKVAEALIQEGLVKVQDDQEDGKKRMMEHLTWVIDKALPDEAYINAVLFLGLATVLLVVGSILLPAIGRAAPEALWSALGAGIGGLAGIFMGSQ